MNNNTVFEGGMPTFLEQLCYEGDFETAKQYARNENEEIILAIHCAKDDIAESIVMEQWLDESHDVSVEVRDSDTVSIETENFDGSLSVNYDRYGDPMVKGGYVYHKPTEYELEISGEAVYQKAEEAVKKANSGESYGDVARDVWARTRGV